MERRKKSWLLGAAPVLLASSLLLAGCRGGLAASAGAGIKGYETAQVMLVAATEMNRYEQVYTDAIWDVVLEDGQTFEAYLLGQVQAFLKDLRTMNLLAKEQEITMTSAEKDRIRQLAERYYDGLTQADIDYMGITLEDVIAMYQEYFLANKVVGTLTKDVNLEVSDSEAKVIVIHELHAADRAKADELYSLVTAEGSDFCSIARQQADSCSLSRELGRGEEEKNFEDAAFALASGEISPVVKADGEYCIIQCVDEYDVEATEERKTQIYAQRKNQVFGQIYSQFQAEQEIKFSEENWPPITVPDGGISVGNFFRLYQEEFGVQGY